VNDDPSGRDRARLDAAIADLSELHSRDPAALPAIHAIRLTRLTLESFWRRDDQQGR
jgi:hypothetical protein